MNNEVFQAWCNDPHNPELIEQVEALADEGMGEGIDQEIPGQGPGQAPPTDMPPNLPLLDPT